MTLRMDAARAVDLLGVGRTRNNDLRPMLRDLETAPRSKSFQNGSRIEAIRYVLRNWSQYQQECRARNEARRLAEGDW